MSLEARITELAQAIGADIKQLADRTAVLDTTGAAENNLIQYVGGQWVKTTQESITDGGNF